ncbi:MAG TPA: AraC family transcriptional regulator ligand-binding domain-containing protein [Polyangiaceae bacterium]
MSNRFRVSTTVIRRLDELGLSHELVLREAGLSPQLFEQERVLLTTQEFFALFRALRQANDDPALGLKLGTEARVERYDPIAIAALYARSFGDALERMARYKQLTCPEKLHFAPRHGECHVHFEWLQADEPEPELLVDLCFAWVAEIARRGSADAVRPKRVELARPEAARALFEAHFGCPVQLAAARNTLVFEQSALARPFVTHNPDLLAIVAPQLESELAEQLAKASFRERVKATLKRSLAGQRPELRVVARELGLSSRTLQRRLTDEHATFQQLIAEARRELARHYLQHSSLELNETAYLLGFEDANSFFRAFQQWEGTTPGEWRARPSQRAG